MLKSFVIIQTGPIVNHYETIFYFITDPKLITMNFKHHKKINPIYVALSPFENTILVRFFIFYLPNREVD